MSTTNNTNSTTERTGSGDEFPDERTMNAEPGLSGGEYPGAEGAIDAMGGDPASGGEATTFGGALGDYGPAGTMGTLDPGNALDTPPSDGEDTQYSLGPERQ